MLREAQISTIICKTKETTTTVTTTTTTTTITATTAAKDCIFEFRNTTVALYSNFASNFKEILTIFMGLHESHSCS